ncbi:hypothetical protein MRX96_010629 [Rhipicephalus microplus]
MMGPPGQCLKQEEDHELSSGVKFVIDPTGDKNAYKRFLAMDCTSDSDESSPCHSSDFIHLDPEPKEPAPVDLQPRELNSAENQDGGPPGQCLKQEEVHELPSGVKFVIDPTGDKDAYERFLAMDCTSDSDESSPCHSSDFIHLDSEPKEPAPVDLQPRVVCFNCGGKHFVNACTEKIDKARIAQRRKEMSKEREVAPKMRYFEYGMLAQRFQPGKYSQELREALNLGPQALPPFIYRMRVLGYPPGWLEYAKVEKSGIKIYGLDDDVKPNEKLGAEEEQKEAGEIDSCDMEEVQYDPTRLVDFPGFNVPVPPGVRDLWREYGMPPMLQHQQKSEVEKHMKAPMVAKSFGKRRKLRPPVIQPSTDIGPMVDMVIDDGTEKKPVCFAGGDIGAAMAADSSTDSKCTSTDASQESLVPEQPSLATDCNNVPYLINAEAYRQEQPSDSVAPSSSTEADRQEQPSNSVDPSSSTQADRQEQPSDSVAPSSSTEADRQEQPSLLDVQNGNTSSSDNSTVDKAKTKTHKVTLGTPMILGFSKYKSLPPRENFAKGMTDYIPYENLPGATGRYEKLRTILEKVRAMREESDEDEES